MTAHVTLRDYRISYVNIIRKDAYCLISHLQCRPRGRKSSIIYAGVLLPEA
jgi:hypothetical protein